MRIDKQWLETVFKGTGDVIAETVKAAAECGSFGLQLMPNAFEVRLDRNMEQRQERLMSRSCRQIFGVDLLLSFDGPDSQSTPIISLLEFNASPDFTQSGNRLRKELGGAFQGVIKLVVAPFFGVKRFADENEDGHPESTGVQVGEEKFGWRKIGEQETRGTW